MDAISYSRALKPHSTTTRISGRQRPRGSNEHDISPNMSGFVAV